MLRAGAVQRAFSSLAKPHKWYQICPISSRIVFIKTDSSPLDVALWTPRFHHDSGTRGLQHFESHPSVPFSLLKHVSNVRPIRRKNSNMAKPGQLDQMVSVSHLVHSIGNKEDISSLLSMLGSGNDSIFVDDKARPYLLVAWLKRLIFLVQEQGLAQDDLAVVKDNVNFQKLLQQLDRKMMKMRAENVIDGLSVLLDIFPEDNLAIESFENHIRWLLRKMYLTNIDRILQMHERHQETVLRQDMLKFIQAVSEKRWGELVDPADVIQLMYDDTPKVSDKFVRKLEEKALDMCGQMSTKNLYRLIYYLAKKKRRNTPLLRGAMYYLGCQPCISLSPVHLMNLVYALTNFKLYHPTLFEKLAMSIINQIQNFEPHMVASLLTSFGVAKFRHPKLLDTLTEYMHDRVSTVSTSDLSALIVTLGNLNYHPQNFAQCFPSFLEQLQTLKDNDRRLWLDVVWSSSVLNRLSAQMVESVMLPEFYSEFSGMKDSFRATPSHLKLTNISSVAKCDLPSYSGPNIPADYLKSKDIKFSNRSERPFHTMILETLLNIAPGEKYAITNQLTQSGTTIDVELIVNNEGEVQPIRDYKPAFGDADASLKDLPQDMYRLALRVNDFQDMTTYTVVPSGVSLLTSRILKDMGYKVAELNYHDFPTKETVVNKVRYLQAKLKEAIQKT